MKKRLNKKAEMTKEQVLGLIVLVVSIGVLLLFLSGIIPWGRTSIDKDTCHTSVVLRSTYNSALFESSKIIPLKCQTENICSNMGGKCTDLPRIDTNVKLSKDDEQAKEQLKKTIADKLYDCNSMVGEGKLNFMPHTFWSQNYCLICSRISFDEGSKKIGNLGYQDLYEYMAKTKAYDDTSYLEAIYGTKSLEDMNKILESSIDAINKRAGTKIESIDELSIDLSKDNGYAIIVQLTPDSTWEQWTATIAGGALVAGGIIAAPLTLGGSLSISGVGFAVLAGGTTGGIIYTKTFPGDGDYVYTYPSIIPYDKETLKSLKCSSFETAP